MAVESIKKARGYKPERQRKPPEQESPRTDQLADPEENWADDPSSEAYDQAERLYEQIQKGYDNKDEQEKKIEEYWNIQRATPDDNQQYSGNSQGYVPAVRDAINARAKRAVKQLFPANNKHVEAVTTDARTPYTDLALLEHYIRKTDLKSIVRSDLIAGDVTGQWGLMVDWITVKRHTTKLVRRNPEIAAIDGDDMSGLGATDPSREEGESKEEETITTEGPEIIDFAAQDLVVIPPTANNLQTAKAVSLRLRMSKEKVKEMEDEGVFIFPPNFDLDELFKAGPDRGRDRRPNPKFQVKDAGVKTEGTLKYIVVYMVWTKLDLGKEYPEEAIIYYGQPDTPWGIIRNPLWSGKRNLVCAPVERVEGSFWGKSRIEPVKFLQWQLNDFWNMGQDSAMYSLLPIWAVDPLLAPQWQQLTMGLAALWPVAPNNVKPLTQPQLYKEALTICEAMKKQIRESLDVTDMMMGIMPPGRKNSQQIGAVSAAESVTVMDHADRYEQVILNPLLEMLFEFDQQFRTTEIAVETMGEIGIKAKIESVPVPQWGEKIFFRWTGTEYQQGLQRMQQQIAATNVLKGIPPQMLGGKTLDLAPMAEMLAENVFGPELAPRILKDMRNQYKIDPQIENEMLWNSFDVQVHEMDDDPAHLQSHTQAAQINGDPMGLYQAHIMAHMQQMQRKREMAMPQKPGGLPGAPGGAGPGVPGTPRPGALPAPGGPRPAQNPPGAVQPTQMADPRAMG